MSTENETGRESAPTEPDDDVQEPPAQRAGEYADSVSSHLSAIHRYGYSRYSIFTDFLDLALYALQGRDDPYLDVMERYSDHNDAAEEGDRPADLFSKAFGELVQGTGEVRMDIIGDVYMRFGCNNEHFGQHFTPHSVARMMGQLTGTVSDEDLAEASPSDPVFVADPASGSGRLLVDVADPGEPVVYRGQDIDSDCAKMMALNLFLTGLTGTVVHGNSLTLEEHRYWRVQNPPFGPPAIVESDGE